MHNLRAFCAPATRLISATAYIERQKTAALKLATPLCAVLILLGTLAPASAQEQPKPVPHITVMKKPSTPRSTRIERPQFRLRVSPNHSAAVNTGSGIVYTCDPSVDATTCNYLNTTVAGYYNDTFTNANADIYITYGVTGLAQSTIFDNFATYSQYKTAYDNIASKSSIQTSADTALTNYAGPAYGGDYVQITPALAGALGILGELSGVIGITADGAPCTYGEAGCYDAVVTISNATNTFYFDNLGGSEPAGEFDFYGIVQHETDEVLGTSSCITTGPPLSNGCDSEVPALQTGTPSVADLFRYSSAGNLVLDSTLSTAPGAYFSYDGGSTDGAQGFGRSPKYYNTLANGGDYADYLSSTPDCATNEAIQDAEGCPGEDAGLTILNDGGSEINILTAIGFGVPSIPDVAATLTTPKPASTLQGTTVTFAWTPGSGATSYVLHLGTTQGGNDIHGTGSTATTNVTFNSLPTNGETVYARLYTFFASGYSFHDYTYTAASLGALTSPAPGTVLTDTTATFNWTAGTGNSFVLHLGTTPGANDLRGTGATTATSATFTGLPADGQTIYARLYTFWNIFDPTYVDYTFTEASQSALTSPSVSSPLPGSTVTFNWGVAAGASGYVLHIGTTPGGNDIHGTGVTTANTVTFSNLPTNGQSVYARLYTIFASSTRYTDYVFTAASH